MSFYGVVGQMFCVKSCVNPTENPAFCIYWVYAEQHINLKHRNMKQLGNDV